MLLCNAAMLCLCLSLVIKFVDYPKKKKKKLNYPILLNINTMDS